LGLERQLARSRGERHERADLPLDFDHLRKFFAALKKLPVVLSIFKEREALLTQPALVAEQKVSNFLLVRRTVPYSTRC
jgi:C4-dicarboxylate-specific signal transduction histidine kinase